MVQSGHMKTKRPTIGDKELETSALRVENESLRRQIHFQSILLKHAFDEHPSLRPMFERAMEKAMARQKR